MSFCLYFKIATTLFDCLEVNDLLRLAATGNAISDIVSRYLIYLRVPAKVLRKIQTKDLTTAAGRLRAVASVYNRRIVFFPCLKSQDSLDESVANVVKIDFPPETIIKEVKVLQNSFFVQIYPKTLFFCHLRIIQTREPQAALKLNETFHRIDNVVNYDVCANTLFVLTTDKKVLTRPLGSGTAGSGTLDELIEFKPNLKLFKEENYSIYKIFMNEQYVVFITHKMSVFLVDATNVQSANDWNSQSYNIFKIDVCDRIRHVNVTPQTIFLFEKEGRKIWDVKIDRSVLGELITRYYQEERPEFLTIAANYYEISEEQKTGVSGIHQNLMALEIKRLPVSIESLTNKDVIDMFHAIGLTDYDKVIKYSNIDGRALMTFDERKIRDVFGIREKSHSACRILDQISFQKDTTVLPPNLFLYGLNYNGLFSKEGNLVTYCEINAPVLDSNEELVAIEVGTQNIVLKTNKNRTFISVKIDQAEETKKRKSSGFNTTTMTTSTGSGSRTEFEEQPAEPRQNGKGKGSKKNKKPKYDGVKKDNARQSTKCAKDRTDWLCLDDLLEKHCPSLMGESDHIYQIQANSGYFNAIVSSTPDQRIRRFETAASFLTYVKHHKLYEPEDILFCAESINKYYIYDEILASPKLLSDIRIIKRKSDHRALWSKYNPLFDTRQNII